MVDEFSYTEAQKLVMYCNIRAHKHCRLSIAHKLEGRHDVSRMARFLGISLLIFEHLPTTDLENRTQDVASLEAVAGDNQ